VQLSHAKTIDEEPSHVSWMPENEEERDAVRQQLDRLLASPLFNQSRRYSGLLQYIVQQTLAGRADELKERTLGVEVFGRSPTYDTTADPVVRTTAAQLRRRIAQYYFEAGHEAEIVIELHTGGYTPEFRRRTEISEPEPTPETEEVPRPRVRWPKMALAFTMGLLAVSGVLAWSWSKQAPAPSALDRFWGPVLDSASSILVCVGQPRRDASPAPDPTIAESLRANSVAWPDAITTTAIGSLIRARGKSYQLRKSGATAFSDLREAPAVMVGGFNNEWIMRLDASLRFRYVMDPGRLGWIQDRWHPERKDWGTSFVAPFSTFDKDYGVITRVMDPTTERMMVIASGIASYGTIAAGEFLTSDKYLQMVARRAPAGWERKNLQVVFSTNVINGNSGPPQILDTWFW